MNLKRKLDSDSFGNENKKRPKKVMTNQEKINLLEKSSDVEKVINADKLGEEDFKELLQERESKGQGEVETLQQSPKNEKLFLLQALEMAKKLVNFLVANDDNTETGIRAKRELERIMYREELNQSAVYFINVLSARISYKILAPKTKRN